MQIEKYLEDKVEFNQKFLDFIDGGDEQEFQELEKVISAQDIKKDRQNFNIIIHLISKIINNHHRFSNFFNKIERILLFLRDDIKQTYSNSEIYNFFKHNKRILYFLFKDKFINLDESIAKQMTSERFFIQAKYPNYFLPEIKDFIPFKLQKKLESQNRNFLNVKKNDKINELEFNQMREIGENESHLCQLIRDDSVNDFISYVNQNNILLTSEIKPSLFETNPFLLKNNSTIIEYSAFFGSVQIFKYLYLNKVEIKPSIWLFAIHSRNAEMIHILEECKIEPINSDYQICLDESIKCHHNEISNYIFDNLMQSTSKSAFSKSIQSFNFLLFSEDLTNPCSFYYLCKSNYIYIVDFLLKAMDVDVNTKTVQCF